MSQIKTNTIQTLAGRNILTNTGPVIQVQTVMTDRKNNIASPNSGNGTPLRDLTVGITPTSSSSRLIVEFMICGEMHQDHVWLIHRNGGLVTTSGEQGRNSVGNSRWHGYAAAWYDRNENSTPSTWYLLYHCIANTTSTHTLILLAEVLVVVIVISTKTEHKVLGDKITTRQLFARQQFGNHLDHNQYK